jgi:hypothetical protein
MIKIPRVFGKKLSSSKSESFCNSIINSYYYTKTGYYFEKVEPTGSGRWFLTIKNIRDEFDLTSYLELAKKNATNGYVKSLVSFYFKESGVAKPAQYPYIETEFACTTIIGARNPPIKGRITSFKNPKYENLPKECAAEFDPSLKNNTVKFIITELFRFINGSLVIKFYKTQASYRVKCVGENRTKGGESLLVVSVGNFIDKLSLEEFLLLLAHWKSKHSGNYKASFRGPTPRVSFEKRSINLSFAVKRHAILGRKK